MATEKPDRRGIFVSNAYADRFHEIIGRSRTATGCLEAMIDWLDRQGPDVQPVLFDKITPQAEIRLLELLLERARARQTAKPK